MKTQRLCVVLTVINAAVLLFLLARPSTGAPEPVPVLRGRALEIVDGRGKVRASITVIPADPSVKMPDGTRGVPETVLLRLIDPNGRPNVKIGASENGAGLGLGGKDEPTYVQVLAQRGTTSLKLTDRDGKEQVIKP